MNHAKLEVSFSSQNCNSLNVSTSIRSQAAKVTSILDLNTEFIFLSDIRLNGRHRQMEDSFRLKYRMIHNSSQNRRGVAILIRNDVQCVILEEVRDMQENVLCMRVELSGREIILGSVYGPNINDLSFYDFLHNLLLRWAGIPLILGGDWNATYSQLPADINPDILFMRALPSAIRTGRIIQLCEERSLTDPYRDLHPEDRDFTYIPSGVLRNNRSRIDFF